MRARSTRAVTVGPVTDADGSQLPGPRAAYAVNWKTVLAVDAALGLAVAIVGVVVIGLWNFLVGVLVAGLGALYVVLVLRRARLWAQLRRDAGL